MESCQSEGAASISEAANLIENVRLTALRGAEILIAPHQTGGCRSRNPHLMGIIERRVWDERDTNPAAIEGKSRGKFTLREDFDAQ